jgi:hypothetical protein
VPQVRPRAVANAVAWAFVLILSFSVVAVAATGLLLPRCGVCHSGGDFGTATRASAHGKVDCAACHVPANPVAKTSFAFQQVTHLGGPIVKSAASGLAAVSNDQCLACHQDVNEKIVSANGLRIKHEVCARGSLCTDCHSATAHGKEATWQKTYSMDQCLHCHGSRPELAKCDVCHEGRRTEERLASGPWRVTHGPNWRQTHGMGDMFTCPTCHPGAFCDKCHGPGLPHTPDFRITHPAQATKPDAKCYTCHKRAFCSDCHGLVMPHPLEFVKTHSDEVPKVGVGVCNRCHSKADCTKCHELHVHPGGAVAIPPVPKVVN